MSIETIINRARFLVAEYEAHSVTDGDIFDLFRAIITADYATADVKAALIAQDELRAAKERIKELEDAYKGALFSAGTARTLMQSAQADRQLAEKRVAQISADKHSLAEQVDELVDELDRLRAERERFMAQRIAIGAMVGWTPIMSRPIELCVHDALAAAEKEEQK